MLVCPIDLKPCCDDICRGGGCIRTGGSEEMIDIGECPMCGKTTCSDCDLDQCECPVEYDDED